MQFAKMDRVGINHNRATMTSGDVTGFGEILGFKTTFGSSVFRVTKAACSSVFSSFKLVAVSLQSLQTLAFFTFIFAHLLLFVNFIYCSLDPCVSR